MSMNYTKELANLAFNQLAKPNGQPVFEHASEALRLLYAFDVKNYVAVCSSRSVENLKKLFLISPPEAVETLRLAKTTDPLFGGEWFVNTTLGRNVSIASGAKLLAHGGITLEDNVVIGEQAQVVTVGHPMHPGQRHLLLIGPINVQAGALIGGSAIILNTGSVDPVTVGQEAIVLPGAIISKSVPAYSVSSGVNKILLEGREYFNENVVSTKLAERLNAHGLARLQEIAEDSGIKIPEDICGKEQKEIPSGSRTITHDETVNLDKLSSFFPTATQEVLRFGLFFPPIHLVGTGRIVLGNNILINTGSILSIDGDFVFGDGSFLAPETEIAVPQGSKLILGKKVWIGAKVKISVPAGETLEIGAGSVVAAGAEVVSSVPPMSVVVGKGKIVDTLGEKNIFPISPELNDFNVYETQRIRLREYIETLSPKEIEDRLSELLALPESPEKFRQVIKTYRLTR